MVKENMSKIFATIPKLPSSFETWCDVINAKIPIYYRRAGKGAECVCGKCAHSFYVDETPKRHKPAKCPICGNVGPYEWKTVTTGRWNESIVSLVQCTKDKKLIIRTFKMTRYFKQGQKVADEIKEVKRILLFLGDVIYYDNEVKWGKNGWERVWKEGKGYSNNGTVDYIYPNYQKEIIKSELKYCNVQMIQGLTGSGRFHHAKSVTDILITFARNPAIEMYTKAGMSKLVGHLIYKEGRDKNINRRGKTPKQQFRLTDPAAVKRFIASKGDMELLKVLQIQKNSKYRWTKEHENFVQKQIKRFEGEKQVRYLLKYMSVQQLMNRSNKYTDAGEYKTVESAISAYYDYLQMRQELGYDMTNEVFLYPKSLYEKHNLMAVEKNAKSDALHCEKQNKKYANIETKYNRLEKKYGYSKDGYVIRPAKNAGEIIIEGRVLHHCVGRDWYLEKHNSGKSFILFLRKEECPEVPYYTIEIQGTKVVQWYGQNDTKPNAAVIEPWLNTYMNSLQEAKKTKKQKVMQAAG